MKVSTADLRTLSDLFDALWDLPDPARDAWFDTLAPEFAQWEPELRAWLDRQRRQGGDPFLDQLPPMAIPMQESGIATPIAGASVGGYLLAREIGRGGMSSVWLAKRTDGGIKRDIALKLPFVHLLASQVADRFARERDILAGLVHPNIARLYDAGIGATGQPYLAMEYVDGVPLVDYCNSHTLPIPDRLQLFQQVLSAVGYAHSRLVLHRDLKPSNMLVTGEGTVQLLDFGIATLVIDGASKDSDLTRFGGRALTPTYASPEQIKGEPLGTASDVYSLGVILFELLTGERPSRPNRDSAGALEEAILHAEAPHLSRSIGPDQAARCGTTPAILARALRGDLDAIVRKALKKAPGERYGTPDAMAQDLEALTTGNPVSARPDSRGYVLRKFIGRNRGAVLAAGAVFLAVLIGGAAALVSARAAIVQRDRALALASRNEAVSSFLKILISDAAESDKPVTVSDMLARSEALVAAENRMNADHQAAVFDVLGLEYQSLGDEGKAESLLRRAKGLVQQSRDPALQALITCDYGRIMARTGQPAEGQAMLHSVLDSGTADARATATCVEGLAYIAQDALDTQEALKLSYAALEHWRRVPNVNLSNLADAFAMMAQSLYLNDRNHESDRYFQDALQQYQDLGRAGSGAAIDLLTNWGVAVEGAGDPKRALAIDDRALKALAARDPNLHPSPALLFNRARTFESMGRYSEALAGNETCLHAAQAAADAIGVELCTYGMAMAALRLGRQSTAEHYLADALRLNAAAGLAGGPTVGSKHYVSARVALARHDLGTARREFDAMIKYGIKGVPPSVVALLGRAEVSLEEGNVTAAAVDANLALAIAQQRQGDLAHSHRTGLAWFMLANIRARNSDQTGAREAARQAVEQFSDTVDPGLPEAVAAAVLAGDHDT